MTQETLTFYGGLNTIGGVQIVYGSGNTGLVFDLGLKMHGLFNSQVTIDPPYGIRNLLLTRMAPPLYNLYEPSIIGDLSEGTFKRLWQKEELPQYSDLHAFVSHIHQDHMALMPYLKAGTPVYMHGDAHSVYKGVVASGEYPDTFAVIHRVDDLQELTIGDFRLQIVEVDHDTPGVAGFILHGREHRIGFTADWRRHGRHSGRMDRFIDLCREAEVDILITEGTRLRPDTIFRKPIDRMETDVAVKYKEVASQASGLVYVNILARNVERVADIIMATKAAGRTLVMDEMTAVLWHVAVTEGIRSLTGHPALEADRQIVRVLPARHGGAVSPEIELPYEKVSLMEVIADKVAYSVYMTYSLTPLMAELESLGELTPSHYVHADGGPLTSQDETLHRWMTEFGVTYHYCATGGHAAPQEISELVQALRQKVVIHLHSVHPSLLDSRGIRKYYPGHGETIGLNQLVDAGR